MVLGADGTTETRQISVREVSTMKKPPKRQLRQLSYIAKSDISTYESNRYHKHVQAITVLRGR